MISSGKSSRTDILDLTSHICHSARNIQQYTIISQSFVIEMKMVIGLSQARSHYDVASSSEDLLLIVTYGKHLCKFQLQISTEL